MAKKKSQNKNCRKVTKTKIWQKKKNGQNFKMGKKEQIWQKKEKANIGKI